MEDRMEETEMNLEEAFAKLDEVIRQLEDKEISLEDSFRTYKSGMELLKLCNDKIDKVEKEILLLNEDGDTDEF